MKSKTIILLAVALICGLGAALLTKNLLANQGSEAAPKVSILVAKVDLNRGISLKTAKKLFVFKPFTQGEEPKKAIRSFKQFKGKYLGKNLRKGDWITTKDLWGPGEGDLDHRIPDGMEAAGLKVTADGSASGFATLPNRRVDVYFTAHQSGSRAVAGILFHNVLVLSAGIKKEANKEGKAMLTPVVNLALTAEQMVLKNLAEQRGKLTLTLRKIGDQTMYKTKWHPEKLAKWLHGEKEKKQAPAIVKKDPGPEVKPVEQPKVKVWTLPEGWRWHTMVETIGKKRSETLYLLDQDGNPIQDAAVYHLWLRRTLRPPETAQNQQDDSPAVVVPEPSQSPNNPPGENKKTPAAEAY